MAGTVCGAAEGPAVSKVYKGMPGVWYHGGDGVAQGGENDLRRWWGSVEYITSRKGTVRLGLLLGLYERFPIKK